MRWADGLKSQTRAGTFLGASIVGHLVELAYEFEDSADVEFDEDGVGTFWSQANVRSLVDPAGLDDPSFGEFVDDEVDERDLVLGVLLLVEEVGESCNITALSGSEVLYLDRVETAWPLRMTLTPGSHVPLH